MVTRPSGWAEPNQIRQSGIPQPFRRESFAPIREKRQHIADQGSGLEVADVTVQTRQNSGASWAQSYSTYLLLALGWVATGPKTTQERMYGKKK